MVCVVCVVDEAGGAVSDFKNACLDYLSGLFVPLPRATVAAASSLASCHLLHALLRTLCKYPTRPSAWLLQTYPRLTPLPPGPQTPAFTDQPDHAAPKR